MTNNTETSLSPAELKEALQAQLLPQSSKEGWAEQVEKFTTDLLQKAGGEAKAQQLIDSHWLKSKTLQSLRQLILELAGEAGQKLADELVAILWLDPDSETLAHELSMLLIGYKIEKNRTSEDSGV